MFYTYVLFSKEFNKIYIGQTENLEHRLATHNSKENKGWSSRFKPWTLFYYEEFQTRSEALKREKELKSYQGRNFIREMIDNIC